LPSSYTTRDTEELEEEQRLLYVAITRARESLCILVHHEGRDNGIHTFNRLSRFVDAANVMACLDRTDLAAPPSAAGEAADEPAGSCGGPQLLARLLDSMK
jgi:ATP-dependent exoDNAse (exonuclease V) beta subunit